MTRSRTRQVATAVLLLLTSGAAAACGGPQPASQSSAPTTLTVLAAASMRAVVDEAASDLERTHPGVRVEISSGSSTTLARQLSEGARADVAVFAGTTATDSLPASIRAGRPVTVIASNTMMLAVPVDNPGQVAALADLANPDLTVVLCVSSAPCGAAADSILTRAGITPTIASRELDAEATITKVRLGEADAAIVYRSDALTAGPSVRGLPIDPADNVTVTYPLITLTDSPLAAELVAHLTSPAGAEAIAAGGFLPPP